MNTWAAPLEDRAQLLHTMCIFYMYTYVTIGYKKALEIQKSLDVFFFFYSNVQNNNNNVIFFFLY